MIKSGRKKKRSDRSSTEEEQRNPKRTNMAASEQEDSAEDNDEPSLSDIRKMLVDLQSTSATILECNNKLFSEMAELKNNSESQKRELNAMKVLVEKTMNLNNKLNEDLALARKKINEQAEDITELYNLQDELEQYTRKNSIEICGIPESAYNSTEEAALKLSEALEVSMGSEDIEISHHLNRKGSEKGIRPIIVKFVSHKVKTQFYKSRAKLKHVRVKHVFPSCSVATRTGGRIFINESLTSFKREVVKKANQMRKDDLINSCWTLDGKIYIKTSPEGKPVRIYEEGDLYNL